MSSRQRIYVGLAVSAGVCSGIVLFLYLRHRRQTALSKTPNANDSSPTRTSLLSSLKSRRGRDYDDITSSEADSAGSESVRFQSGGANIEVKIPGGDTPLTAEQAILLTRFLDENENDIELLHRILTNIANAGTFNENQVYLANAGCIERLRELLLTTESETTKCKILLALNNLALNEHTITHFSDLVSFVINLCRTTPSKSLVRLYGLNLLVNMSVLEHLHNEYIKDINELGSLIQSTFDNNDETLSAGKILVNLSTNKQNLFVINLCRTTPSKSLVRLYGLNLLVNMSVLEHLHNEYIKDINELGSLIQSTFDNNDETLSAGKILVNLSTNKQNLENLLKLTGIEIKTIVQICTPKKKIIDSDESSKLEENLLRYLTFYCNLAETIVNELKLETKNQNLWLLDPIPYGQGAVYFELFDHDTQMSTKSILRPQYQSYTINNQIKRLRQAMDTIRQIQFDSTVSSVQDEFDENEHTPTMPDSSTPRKNPTTLDELNPIDDSLNNLEKDFDEEFADDDTIQGGDSTPSNQSLASFSSALSTNENNTFTSPDK
ncbi:unnamed protein product [Adineta steineri]|uniref:Armadillo repeat-containing domain-containing protein n=1 Tax=Adineta steineri TaxID=433720 RepID=A0A814KJJ6_9BILA|nr:unnamed protein product [Adineta steineri]